MCTSLDIFFKKVVAIVKIKEYSCPLVVQHRCHTLSSRKVILVVDTLVNVVGNASEGLVLAFAVGLLVIAPIDGLSGCDSNYTRKQRIWREVGVLVTMLALLTLGASLSFGAGFMLGGPLAMGFLQSLYKDIPQPAFSSTRHTM